MDFRSRFKKLSLSEKLVVIGGAVAVISVFLPWYKDVDTFRTSEMFLGVTGPLYLAGLIAGFCGFAAMGIFGVQLFGKKKISTGMKDSSLLMVLSVVAMAMALIALSVFFHPKFGLNIATKSVGLGIPLLFVGNLSVLAGALLFKRLEAKSVLVETKEEEIESMLNDREPGTVGKSYDLGTMAIKNSIYDYQRGRDIDHAVDVENNK